MTFSTIRFRILQHGRQHGCGWRDINSGTELKFPTVHITFLLQELYGERSNDLEGTPGSTCISIAMHGEAYVHPAESSLGARS